MGATTGGGGGGGGGALPITNPWLVLDEPTLAKPASLAPMFPGPFNLKVTRIVGDPGTTITFSGGPWAWGSDPRHHHSAHHTGAAEGTPPMLQNNGPPSELHLHAATYPAQSLRPDASRRPPR